MAGFAATDSALVGFRFVREHPRAALTWAVVALVFQFGIGALMVALGGPQLMQLQAMRGRQPADPTAALGLLAHLLPLYALLLVFALVFYPVLYAAMNRAVLRPQESRSAYFRLSGDEVRQLLLLLLIAAVVIGGGIVAFIIGGIVSIGLRSAAPWASFIVVLLICAGWIYVWVRLSLASPLTFASGRVDLFGSWELTRGRFWPLFGTYVLVAALTLVVAILVLVIGAVIALITGGGFNGGAMFRADSSSFATYFAPARIVMMAVWGAAMGLIWPLTMMPAPEIYRQLSEGDGAA